VATIRASGSLPPLFALRLAAKSAISKVTGSILKPLSVQSVNSLFALAVFNASSAKPTKENVEAIKEYETAKKNGKLTLVSLSDLTKWT
jgi:hypothetical protein